MSTDHSPPQADPSQIMQLATAYWGSQTLLTANRVGLFQHLSEAGTMNAEALAGRLGFTPRTTTLFLNACVALGLLAKDNDGSYRNSTMSEVFLVPGAPGFMGNTISYSDNLYATWGQLDAALRTGKPQMATETYTGDDEQKTRHFVYGMHDRALGIGRAMIGLLDLGGRKRMLDVGGGPGTYSSLLARANPGLTSQVFDLPGVVKIAAEIIDSFGVADRVGTYGGDYLNDTWPSGNDVVLISGVFHRESEAGCRQLIARAKAALQPGGLLIIGDVFTDADHTSPMFATLFGLNMMLTAPEGGVHADADVGGWLSEGGFESIDYRPFPPPMPHRLVMGTRA